MEPNDIQIASALTRQTFEEHARSLDRDSQCRKIARHLIKGGSISNMTAFKIYGIVSLHRRLFELRERGFPVNFGRFVQYGGKRFKIYEMYPKQDVKLLTKIYG